MSKILKNTTGSPIAISDTGIQIAASPGQYTIPANEYSLWAGSSDVIKPLADGDLLFNDGSNDYDGSNGYDISTAIDIIKDCQPNFVNTSGGGLIDVLTDGLSNKRLAVDVLISNSNPVASCYTSGSPGSYLMRSGSNHPIPFDNTEFQTVSGMHDSSVHTYGTATGIQSSTTIQDTTKTWLVNQFQGFSVRLIGGSGSGQWRKVLSNTSNTITVNSWITTPVSASTTYQVTNSNKIIVPVGGFYRITGHASFGNGGAGSSYSVQLYVNGSFKCTTFIHDNSSVELGCIDTKILYLAQNDYVEMSVYNGSGGDLALNAGQTRTFLQINKVG